MAVNNLTLQCYTALVLDLMPTDLARASFGLRTRVHYGALQYAVKFGGITEAELDAVIGNEEKIQALVDRFPNNPYRADFRNVPIASLFGAVYLDPQPDDTI